MTNYVDLIKKQNRQRIERANAKALTLKTIADVASMYLDVAAKKINESTKVNQEEVSNILNALYEQSSIDDFNIDDFKKCNTIGKLYDTLKKV